MSEAMKTSFDPAPIERRWYREWERSDFFAPRGDGPPYCIMLPPPNVTGRLHMGHAFQHTIMDALTRYQRMDGRRALWQCGTDHAGIATQMVVERQLAAAGQSRHDLGRERFVEAVWAWRAESGGEITRQMRRLGDSVDWANERFTMDEGLSAAVTRVFVDLHEKGLIYRGQRLVNWDPVLHTALSDLEVVPEETRGSLWHLKYPRADGSGHVVVATTRPETMLGDVAVAVHPDDERNRHLVGTAVELPLTGRTIPVIADDYVDPEFGTGCVKITPAHDFNDYLVGQRHGLEPINVFTADATLNENAPEAYRGLDRFDARARIVADLEAQGLVDRIEEHTLSVPRGDRSGAILEPFLTDQWFVRAEPLARPAIEAVREGRIKFVPESWDRTYYQWMENIQDWCISRQLWWGHRIPAWYDADGAIYVGFDEADARRRHGLADEVPLRQDPDVLDTWFSSALWPFSTLGWPERTERLQTFYPTDVLVTGFDIIFFWVARMIMMGLEFMGEVPFREVYITGLIRDHEGQKMSKSKGNILDPLDLIDGIDLEALVAKRVSGLMQPQMAAGIERATRREFPQGIKAYGADALRLTFAALATQGRDIRLDTGRVEGYRNFCNKLWNAARYVLMNAADGARSDQPEARSVFDRWILSRLDATVATVRTQLESYRLDLATQALYEFTWHEYCDWYLELTKPVLADGDGPAQRATRHTLLTVLEALLRAWHPLIPFVTEEIWQRVAEALGIEQPSIMLRPYPQPRDRADAAAEADVAWLQALLLGVRQIRGEMDIPPGKPLRVLLEGGGADDRQRMTALERFVIGLGRLERVEWIAEGQTAPQSAVALAGSLKIHIPLAGLIDPDEEIARLEKELVKRNADLERAERKLANENFTAKAPPAVVDRERARLEAARAAASELESQIARLAGAGGG